LVLLGAFLDKINVKSEENAMKNRVKELRDAKHLTQTGLALKGKRPIRGCIEISGCCM